MKNSPKKASDKLTTKTKKKNNARLNMHLDGRRICTIIAIGIGLFVWLNLAIYFQSTLIDDARSDQLDRLTEQRAKILAESAEIYINSIRQQLAFFSEKPALSQALAAGDEQALEKAKSDLLQRLNEAKSVSFFLNGQATHAPDANPPIRFTELEMIRRAEQRERVFPEAVRIDKQWQLNFIVPLPYGGDDKPVGVALVVVGAQELGKRIVQGQASLGKVELHQQFKGKKPITVLSIGSGDMANEAKQLIKDTYWKIHFTPSLAMYENAKTNASKAYAFIGALLLAILAACFMGGRAADRFLEKRKQSVPDASAERNRRRSSNDLDNLGVPLYKQTDVLDVEINEGDEDLLGFGDVADTKTDSTTDAADEEDILDVVDKSSIPDVIFRAYDIRGIAKEQVTTELARLVGQAVGSEAIDAGEDTLVVARDARTTSPELTEFLIRGVLSSGCNVLNIGTVPTPLMYFSTATLNETQSGIMVTASHNPAEYNGFKIVINGKSRCGDDIKSIRRRILKQDLYEGSGVESSRDIVPAYIDTIFADVALAGDVSLVIDAGNGVTGIVAPRLFEELGCHVVPLFCELNGEFPNHSPDPSIASNLTSLITKVKETNADLGVAFDGDGDRLIVVTPSGQIIWPDQLLMMFSKDIVSRNPGADVVFDVKSTKHLVNCITSHGGRPIMWKTGHGPMKSKMAETGALLGGEYSGHIFIKDRWFGFDDGMYAAARLIEILALQGESLDDIFTEFPSSPSTPEIRVPVGDERKFDIIAKLATIGEFAEGRLTDIDGVRVDYPFGWGLVRASNTSPNLTMRFEADDEESLHKIKSTFAKQLKRVDNSLIINWNH